MLKMNLTTNPGAELNALKQENSLENNIDNFKPNEFMFNPKMDKRIIHQIEFRDK